MDLPFSKFNTNQRKELIARNLRSRNSRIDVFSVDLIWVPRFTKWAEPLTPYFPSSTMDAMLDVAAQTCYVDGILYAVPLYLDIGVLYYRQDMIRALPDGKAIESRILSSITWEELLSLGKQHFPEQPWYLFHGANYEGLVCTFNEILGQELQNRRTGEFIDFTSTRVIERVAFMRQLIHSIGATPVEVLQMTEDPCIEYALLHDIPFVRGWPTVNNEVDQRFDPEKFSQMRIAPVPHFAGERSTPVFGGWNLMLSRHSPVKDEALLFMQFVVSQSGQDVFYRSNSQLPVLKRYYQPGENADARLIQLAAMMEQGLFRPQHPDYTRISDVLADHLHMALTGEMSVRDAMKSVQARISGGLPGTVRMGSP